MHYRPLTNFENLEPHVDRFDHSKEYKRSKHSYWLFLEFEWMWDLKPLLSKSFYTILILEAPKPKTTSENMFTGIDILYEN